MNYHGEEKNPGAGRVLSPTVREGSMVDDVEDHLISGDRILQAVLDIAERGHLHSSDVGENESSDRFYSIVEFIRLYRAGNAALIEALPRGEKEA